MGREWFESIYNPVKHLISNDKFIIFDYFFSQSFVSDNDSFVYPDTFMTYMTLRDLISHNYDDLQTFVGSDFIEAVENFIHHVINSESIIVIGDYDVDGLSSSAIMKLFFKEFFPDKRVRYITITSREKTPAEFEDVDFAIYVDLSGPQIGSIYNFIIDHHSSVSESSLVDTFGSLDKVFVLNPFYEKTRMGLYSSEFVTVTNLHEVSTGSLLFLFMLIVSKKLISEKKIEINKVYNFMSKVLSLSAFTVVSDVRPFVGLNHFLLMTAYNNQVFNKKFDSSLEFVDFVRFVISPMINSVSRVSNMEYFVEDHEVIDILVEQKDLSVLEIFYKKYASIKKLLEINSVDYSKFSLSFIPSHFKKFTGLAANILLRKSDKPIAIIASPEKEGDYSNIKVSIRSSIPIFDKIKDIVASEGVQFGGHSFAIGLSSVDLNKFEKVLNVIDSVDFSMQSYLHNLPEFNREYFDEILDNKEYFENILMFESRPKPFIRLRIKLPIKESSKGNVYAVYKDNVFMLSENITTTYKDKRSIKDFVIVHKNDRFWDVVHIFS